MEYRMDRNTAEQVARVLYPGDHSETVISKIMKTDPLETINELESIEADKKLIDCVWCFV